MLDKFKNWNLSKPKLSSGMGKILANVSWLFADRILRMGISLVVGIWVARYLGVQQYGVFNYATAFVGLFIPLTTLGLDNLVINKIVSEPLRHKEVLGTAFSLKLFGSITSLLLIASSIYYLHQGDNLNIWLIGILGSAGIFHAFETVDLWFQSQVQSKYTVIAKNTVFIIIALTKVALIQANAPLIAFAWIALLESGLNAISLVIAYKIQGYSLTAWSWSFSVAKTLLKQSWFMILSDLSIMVYMRIDQIMLGNMIGDKAVGIYSAATRISEIWYFIPMAIVSSVSPTIFAAKKTNESLYYQYLKRFIQGMILLSLIIVIPMTFLSETIVKMLFGSSYIAAAKVLEIHIWSSLFIFISVAISPWFIAEGLTHLSFYRTVAGAISNIVMNIFLIPKYGENGAAIATLISYGFTAWIPKKIIQSFLSSNR